MPLPGHELASLANRGEVQIVLTPAEPPDTPRAAWNNKMQFMLSIIGYSVGLGNIWRFPYLCQQNGGGAFLIPFAIMLVLEGIPLFLIELGIGQKMRLGSLGVWNTVHPWLGGIGIASCIVTFFVALYYNVIITWCFYYFFNSFQGEYSFRSDFTDLGSHLFLPCPLYNTCVATFLTTSVFVIPTSSSYTTGCLILIWSIYAEWLCQKKTSNHRSPLPWANCPKYPNGTIVPECEKSSETAYFWYRSTLDISPTMEDTGGIKWWIAICLLIAWTIVFLIVMKGIQSSGKVVYFTSLFPYIVLTIFFIRGITLKGAGEGLKHMYTPKVEKLLQPTIWLDAATQVFYSFGLAFGSLIAFGSYNPPKNNCVRDVILVSVCNAFTAIYASIVVFTILGFKAVSNVDKCIESNKLKLESSGFLERHASLEQYEQYMQKISNETYHNHNLEPCNLQEELDQAAEGTGLAFIVFTQAIVELPGAPFWAVIFFLMLLSLGIGSQIGILEGMLCTIFDIDLFKRIRKPVLTAFVCGICFLVGLIFTTGAGEYWLKMFDSFAGTIGLVMIAFLEMVAVMFIYGHQKFTQDIEDMTGYRPGWFWQVTWRFLAPLIMFTILASSIAFRFIEKPSYHAWNAALGQTKETPYPGWVLIIAVLMITTSVIPIPLVFLLRRFQCLKYDMDIHQGAIRRIDTTVSTKEMIADVDQEEFLEETDDESDDDGMNCNDNVGKVFKMEVLDF